MRNFFSTKKSHATPHARDSVHHTTIAYVPYKGTYVCNITFQVQGMGYACVSGSFYGTEIEKGRGSAGELGEG